MRRRKTVRWVVVGALVVAAVVAVGWRFTVCGPSGGGDGGGEAPITGYTAPAFSLSTLDGGMVELSQLRGRWVLVNFWTTWCPACVAMQPHLQAASEERVDKIEFIGINLGEGENKVRTHVGTDITFTIALDAAQTVGAAYRVRYLPTLVLIDEEGIVRGIRQGAFRSKADLDAWLDQLISG